MPLTRHLSAVAPAAAAAAALLLGAAAFTHWTATSGWAFPRFLLALLLLVYLPGRALLGRAGLPRPLDELALSLGLGMVAVSAVYGLAGALGQRSVTLACAPAAALVLLRWRWRPRLAGARAAHVALVGLAVAACVPLALLPFYYQNLSRTTDGLLTYAPLPDVLMHLALANGLRVSVPPDLPFLPGHALRYHYGMDLLPAALSLTGLDVADLTLRFVPSFLAVLLVLCAFCLGRAWLASAAAALLFSALVTFGEDLAWVPGWITSSPQPWAVHFFGMPSVTSLYGLNPMLPGLALFFLGLLCLMRFSEEGGSAWVARAAVLLAAVAAYKVFLAAHALVALAATSVLHFARFRDRRPAMVLAAATALAAPLMLMAAGAGSGVRLALEPWPYVPAALIRCGLWDTGLGRSTAALLERGQVNPLTLLAFFGAAVPLYLAATFGARVVGVPRIVASLRAHPGQPVRPLLAAFVLLGPLLALLLAITPATYAAHERYNEAAWFLVQAKYAAWLFAVEVLWQWTRRRPRWRPALAALVLLVSIPATVQYLRFQRSVPQLRRLGPQEIGLLGWLRAAAPPRTVVLARPEVAEAVAALTSCRAPVVSPAVTVLGPVAVSVTRSELEGHARALSIFWESWRGGQLQLDVVRAYGASLVVADRLQDGPGPLAAGRGDLRTVFDNERYVVVAVVPAQAGAGSATIRP